MFNVRFQTLFLIGCFFIFTPGVFIRLPAKGDIYLVAMIHAILFGIVFFIVASFLGIFQEGAVCKDRMYECPTAGILPANNNVCNPNNKGLCNSQQTGLCIFDQRTGKHMFQCQETEAQ